MIHPDQERRQRFAALADATLEPTRRYLARRTDRATADDVLSDVLLVCWRRLDDVPADPLPWVFVVARNCLRNAQRSARRRDRLAARLAEEERSAPDGGDETAVREALATLRPADAELLRLSAWEGLAPAQIATALGITPNATSIRLHRARARLAEALRKTGDVAGHVGATEGHGR